jgi:hypothetical protein
VKRVDWDSIHQKQSRFYPTTNLVWLAENAVAIRRRDDSLSRLYSWGVVLEPAVEWILVTCKEFGICEMDVVDCAVGHVFRTLGHLKPHTVCSRTIFSYAGAAIAMAQKVFGNGRIVFLSDIASILNEENVHRDALFTLKELKRVEGEILEALGWMTCPTTTPEYVGLLGSDVGANSDAITRACMLVHDVQNLSDPMLFQLPPAAVAAGAVFARLKDVRPRIDEDLSARARVPVETVRFAARRLLRDRDGGEEKVVV